MDGCCGCKTRHGTRGWDGIGWKINGTKSVTVSLSLTLSLSSSCIIETISWIIEWCKQRWSTVQLLHTNTHTSSYNRWANDPVDHRLAAAEQLTQVCSAQDIKRCVKRAGKTFQWVMVVWGNGTNHAVHIWVAVYVCVFLGYTRWRRFVERRLSTDVAVTLILLLTMNEKTWSCVRWLDLNWCLNLKRN